MKNIIVPAVAALMVLGSTAAFADSVVGTVTTVNDRADQFTLDNGQTYVLTAPIEIKALNPGQKVKLDLEGDTNLAKWVTFSSDGLSGLGE